MIHSTAAYRKRVGIALRNIRTISEQSQEVFAEKLRMHRTYYSAIERGEKNLTLNTLQRVCKLHSTPISTIIAAAEALPTDEIA